MTYVVNIATNFNLKIYLFPPYVPLYKSMVLTSNEYLIEEYLDTDTICEFIIKFKNNNNLTLKDIYNVLNGKKPSSDFISKIYEFK